MPCPTILFSALLFAAPCSPGYDVPSVASATPYQPAAVSEAMPPSRERLPDHKLAKIRGGRSPFARSDQLLSNSSLRELTDVSAATSTQMDDWWASTGATIIAVNYAMEFTR